MDHICEANGEHKWEDEHGRVENVEGDETGQSL